MFQCLIFLLLKGQAPKMFTLKFAFYFTLASFFIFQRGPYLKITHIKFWTRLCDMQH